MRPVAPKADLRPFQISAASIADWLSLMRLDVVLPGDLDDLRSSIASISSSEPSTSTISSASTSIG
jgi:hypothetical protein